MGAEKTLAIVINKQNYSDHDEIVTFLSQNKPISMICLGTRKPQSKNALNLQIYSLVEVEFFRSSLENRMSRLKKAVLISVFDLNNQYVISIVNQLQFLFRNITYSSKKFIKNYELFLSKIGGRDTYNWLTWLLANSPIINEIKPYFKNCVLCKSNQDLQYFSFDQGGMFCSKHTPKTTEYNLLMAYYFLFNDPYKYVKQINSKNNQIILKELLIFFKENGFN